MKQLTLCLTLSLMIAASASAQELLAETPAESGGGCVSDFIQRRKQLTRRSILNPLIAIPATAGITYGATHAGAIIGRAVSETVSWGTIAGAGWGFMAGFWGGTVFFAARETVLVAKLIDNLRMQRLIHETAGPWDPSARHPILEKLSKKVRKFGQTVSLEVLANTVRSLNASRALCDGSLTGRRRTNRLKKRLVSLPKLARRIANL